jgi:hypothetical protein
MIPPSAVPPQKQGKSLILEIQPATPLQPTESLSPPSMDWVTVYDRHRSTRTWIHDAKREFTRLEQMDKTPSPSNRRRKNRPLSQ